MMKSTIKNTKWLLLTATLIALFARETYCGSNKLFGEDFLGQRAMMGSENEEEALPHAAAKKNPADPGVGVSASGTTTPVVPSAQGVGAQVYVPCSECKKLIMKFVSTCVDQETNGAQVGTFRAFCENSVSSTDPKNKGKRADFCMMLNAKLAATTGETGQDLVDPTKAPDVCSKFKNECDKLGGGPECYSGFCDEVAECIDCPSALVDTGSDGTYEMEVCAGNGVCRLGWKDGNHKGGNGYCECTAGTRGLACNKS